MSGLYKPDYSIKTKQYCRYCIHLTVGDWPWCGRMERFVSESAAKRTNHCPHFEFCEMDAFLENERPYTPRKEKPREPGVSDVDQVSFLSEPVPNQKKEELI